MQHYNMRFPYQIKTTAMLNNKHDSRFYLFISQICFIIIFIFYLLCTYTNLKYTFYSLKQNFLKH